MDIPDMDDVRSKANDAAHRAGDTLQQQWQQIREQAPELMYPSVAEAAAANARRTEANIAYYRDNPSMLSRRIAELDDEWDTRRVLQVATSGLSLAGFWFSFTKSRMWTLLPIGLAGCSLHHGLTGGGPAEDMARRLGFRTREEIEYERRALMRLRESNDFPAGGTATGAPTSISEPQMTSPAMG